MSYFNYFKCIFNTFVCFFYFSDLYPSVDLPNSLFDGILYRDLPVISVRATRNNTIMNVSVKGKVDVQYYFIIINKSS